MVLSEERRQEIEELLLVEFSIEGVNLDDRNALRSAFLGISKRINELANTIGVEPKELVEFCWWMVERMIE